VIGENNKNVTISKVLNH